MVHLSHFLAPVVALSGVLHGVTCSPVSQSENNLDARQGFFAVTGVTEGGVQPRLELRQLQNTKPLQWNLFLQALERTQRSDQQTLASWYGIAGIHGNPVKPWDGVQGNGNNGYCPHSSNLFGPWHRPYLALLEQRLHFHAVNIANEFPPAKRQANRNAARDLRLPYWDWAARLTPVLPGSLTSPQISVTRPNGNRQSIRNPLFSYQFHPLIPGDFGNFRPISVYTETKRAPAGTDANSPSQNGRVEQTLSGQSGSLRSRTYNLLAQDGRYNLVTNHGSGSQGDTFESTHDVIHSAFGSNSHMLYLSFSAMDPVFFMHHCNVDRQLALWQFLHPNSYVEPAQQPGGTYTIPAGSTQGPDSPLTPFHRTEGGQWWTSNGARTTQVFGYTYPELAGNPSQASVRARINQLYGPQAAGVAPGIGKAARGKRSPQADTLDLDIQPGQELHQYVAEVTVPLNALGGPYSVGVFLGTVSTVPADWATDASYIGSHSVLGMPGMDSATMVTGQIPLTNALLAKFATGDLEALDFDSVTDYVKKNLKWRIQQNGERVARTEVPDAKVVLLDTTVQARTSPSDFPTYLNTDTVAPLNGTETED